MNKLKSWLPGVLLTVIAGITYLVMLSDGAAPGYSTRLITTQLGLFPKFAPVSPLWHAVATLLSSIGGRHAISLLNAFSALCGALVVGLLYDVMRSGITMLMSPFEVKHWQRDWMPVIGGTAAAVALAFCVPFMAVANRAHMATFDLLLLMVAARLLTLFIARERFIYAILLALLYGASVAEFATMIVLFPVFAGVLLYFLWYIEGVTFKRVLTLTLCGLAGLMVYPISAWIFHGSLGYELRLYDNYWQLLWIIWRDQAFLISRSLPREGWLIILFLTAVPWVTMLMIARRGLNIERGWGMILLHIIMTALCGAVWLNVPIAPWPMLGWSRMLVTPYLLTAMVQGYLVVYWLMLPGEWWDYEFSPLFRRIAGGLFAWIVALGLVVTSLVMPFVDGHEAVPRNARPVNALAEILLEGLDDCQWLVTNGVLDDHIRLAAYEQGRDIQLISLPAGRQRIMLEYTASLFDDIRLQNLATVSLSALFREWLQPGSEAVTNLAVMAETDLWQRQKLPILPAGLVYRSYRPGTDSALDPDRQEAMLSKLEPVLQTLEAAGDRHSEALAQWARTHAGRVSNDLGVALENAGRDEEAWQMYQAARRIDSSNISALLNLSAMVEAGRAEDAEGEISEAIQDLEANLDQRYHIWSLSRVYGTVRAPQAFAQLGWTWAYSGQPAMALAEMERASELMPDSQNSALEALRAELYMMDNQPLQGESIYRSILESDPANQQALRGMYRIMLGKREYVEAAQYLRQAVRSGYPRANAELDLAAVNILRGAPEAAVESLDDLLIDDRGNLRGWVLLAEAGFALNDTRTIERALRRIENIQGPRGYHAALIRARLAFNEGDLRQAAEFYGAALRLRPNNMGLREQLIRIELVLQRADQIHDHVRALLQHDPGHALALYVRGSLQIAAGEYRLAENSLRRSLARQRLPMALNDLAWILKEQGEFEEAEQLIDEALAITPAQPAAWDTKGVLLLRQGRLQEAEEAIGRSLALDNNIPTVHLHMGEVQLALGNRGAVADVVALIEPVRDQLPPREREIFRRLSDALDD